jgi:hypothetical protein
MRKNVLFGAILAEEALEIRKRSNETVLIGDIELRINRMSLLYKCLTKIYHKYVLYVV